MNYERPELIDALAREYVLGTLRGRARARFERLLAGSFQMARAVADWETRLYGLYTELPPVDVPPAVWRRIQAATHTARPEPRRGGWFTAAAASLIAAVFAVLYFSLDPRPELPAYQAVLSDSDAVATWSIQVYEDSATARAVAVASASPPAGRVFELWMLPEDDSAPVSLGVIGTGDSAALALDDRQLRVLTASKALAISIEPPGGSPTGVPTGDVVFVGALIEG
ncbi:MAG: anti-sigma factor [Pseudomonadota bacterium]